MNRTHWIGMIVLASALAIGFNASTTMGQRGGGRGPAAKPKSRRLHEP